MHFFLTVDTYLAEWYTHRMGCRTITEEIYVKPSSHEYAIIKEFVTERPANCLPEDVRPVPLNEHHTVLCFHIPDSKAKPTRRYNYISTETKNALRETLTLHFRRDLFDSLNRVGCIGKMQKDLFYAYLRSRGMDMGHWDTIAKMYQRMRRSYLSSGHRDETADVDSKS